jgi:hypothetical protein
MKHKFLLTAFIGMAIGFTSCETIEDETSGGTVAVTSNIETPTVWTSANTYIIEGELYVKANLTIEPGTIIKFKQGAAMYVAYHDSDYATVKALGTQEKPIRFTSYAPSPAAGDYDYIGFYSGANHCEFVHCIFEFGGKNQYYGTILIDETAVKFDNCQFLNIKNSAIILTNEGSFSQFTNNTFTSIEKNAIEIESNKVHTIGEGNSFNVGSRFGISVKGNLNQAGTYTWLNHNAPYIISESIYLGASGNGVTLNINAGSSLKFANEKAIYVSYNGDTYGKIIARGTETNPIVFTSNSTSPQAGDYEGIQFYNGSSLSEFSYCTFEYAGKDLNKGGIFIKEANIKFTNCRFENMKYNAIFLETDGRFTEFTNNHFASNLDYSINITSNYVGTIGTGNTFGTNSMGIKVEENLNKPGIHTWLNHEVPYVISGDFYIGSDGNGVILTLNPGIVIKFTLGATMYFAYNNNYGKLIANGTAANPITFTSAAPSAAKGDWNGLYFYEGSSESALSHCEILYAGRDTNMGAFMLDNVGHNTITLTHSRIAFSKGYGITVDSDSSIDYSTVTFDNNDCANYHER